MLTYEKNNLCVQERWLSFVLWVKFIKKFTYKLRYAYVRVESCVMGFFYLVRNKKMLLHREMIVKIMFNSMKIRPKQKFF